eukprot:403364384
MQRSKQQYTCIAKGCAKNHNTHYCSFCKCSNANHLSRNCPTARHLYHGTTLQNFIQMCNEQGCNYVNLKPSEYGNMGPGIYLTTLVEAIKIADYKADGHGAVVIKVAVNLGKLKQCSDLQPSPYFDIEEFTEQKFDSATSIHERWADIDYPFRQWVVRHSNKLRVTDAWLLNGTLNSKLTVPNANVYIMPSFQIKNQTIKAPSFVKLPKRQGIFSSLDHKNVSSLGGVISECQDPEASFISVLRQNMDLYEQVGYRVIFSGYLYEGTKIFHKEGILSHFDNDSNEVLRYQGGFYDGYYHGKGLLKQNGCEFLGTFKHGELDGSLNSKIKILNREAIFYAGHENENEWFKHGKHKSINCKIINQGQFIIQMVIDMRVNLLITCRTGRESTFTKIGQFKLENQMRGKCKAV